MTALTMAGSGMTVLLSTNRTPIPNPYAYPLGLLTTVWVTAIIVLSNVVIFILVPHLAINSERHHYRSTQQTHMLVKMAFFQVFNTTIAVLAFLLFRWNRPLSPSTVTARARARATARP